VITRVLRLEQVQEYVDRSRESQVGAENLVSSHEHPAVEMELGGGNVELGQKLPLEAGKPEFDLLEHSCVYEAEGGLVAPLIIGADWLTGRTRPHDHSVVMLFIEREVFPVTLLETEDVKVGVNGRGFTQQGRGGPQV